MRLEGWAEKMATKLKKFFFGSIRRKVFLGFFGIILFALCVGLVSLHLSQTYIEGTIGVNSVLFAQKTLDMVDRGIYHRVEQVQLYASDLSEETDLIESNQFFGEMQNPKEYALGKNLEWIRKSGEGALLMKSITDTNLSKEIASEFLNAEFYAGHYGHLVFGEAFLTNKFGANVAQTGPTSDYYQADEKWWQEAKAKGLFVGDVFYDKSAAIHGLEIASRLEDRQGNFLGVFKAVLNLKEVTKIVDEMAESVEGRGYRFEAHEGYESMRFELANKEARVFYSTTDFEPFEPAGEYFFSMGEEQDAGYFHYYDEARQKDEFFAQARAQGYKDYGGNGWVLLIKHDSKEMFQPMIDLRNLVLLVFLLAVFFAVFLALAMSKAVTSPLGKLFKATQRIEKGLFDTRVDIKTGDETQELGEAFNKMTAVLENTDKEHKQLEHAKTEFLSITSHELRSPMTPMKAQLQMLEKGFFGKLNKKQLNSVDIVLRNTERLDFIIQDFLEISRIEAARLKFRFEKTSLTKHVNRVIEEMKGFLPEKNIEIVSEIPKLPSIEVDPNRVMQVLRNLLNNAKKFSPKGKKIFVKALAQGQEIRFMVKDQGIGILKKNQRRVFEPFFQEEQTIYRQYGGTGLGLTICKGIIESQGGSIWLESEKGKGTTIYFTVPFKPVKEIKPIKMLFSEEEND